MNVMSIVFPARETGRADVNVLAAFGCGTQQQKPCQMIPLRRVRHGAEQDAQQGLRLFGGVSGHRAHKATGTDLWLKTSLEVTTPADWAKPRPAPPSILLTLGVSHDLVLRVSSG